MDYSAYLVDKINVCIDNDELASACSHASLHEQNSEQLKHNKELSLLGDKFILAAYAVFLYKEGEICSSSLLSRKLQGSDSRIIEKFHKDNEIEA